MICPICNGDTANGIHGAGHCLKRCTKCKRWKMATHNNFNRKSITNGRERLRAECRLCENKMRLDYKHRRLAE
jgi:hypothetical protein